MKFLGLIFLFLMVFYGHEFVEYEKRLMNSEYFFLIYLSIIALIYLIIIT